MEAFLGPDTGTSLAVTVAANGMPVDPQPSGLWVEPKDAQFLVAAAGLRDPRGPRDRLLTRG